MRWKRAVQAGGRIALASSLLVLAVAGAGCGFFDSESEAAGDAASGGRAGADRGGGGPQGGRGGPGRWPGAGTGEGAGESSTAIPVRLTPVVRRAIAQFLETNGTVESDNDVALVARTSGPIEELRVEEGMRVAQGQLLARIDADEVRARLEHAKVTLGEAELAFTRAKAQYESEILSRELYDQAAAKAEAARAQVRENEVQLAYTDIQAPFAGVIVERFVRPAQYVQSGTQLFRIASFDPLQCPIQVPEKDLARLRVGQAAYLTVEAFGEERFPARVLRVSPVVDSASGTVKVTLEVETRSKLRPGMFASVFLETDRHDDALVIPKGALVLESIGDTVYVKVGDVAERREVRLGFDEGDHVEVLAGLEEGDQVVTIGQDSLADGTPIYVLEQGTTPPAGVAPAGVAPAGAMPSASGDSGAGRGGGGPGRPGAGGPDPSAMTPEMLEGLKERMRARGMSERDIEQRLEAMKRGEGRPGGRRPAGLPPG